MVLIHSMITYLLDQHVQVLGELRSEAYVKDHTVSLDQQWHL